MRQNNLIFIGVFRTVLGIVLSLPFSVPLDARVQRNTNRVNTPPVAQSKRLLSKQSILKQSQISYKAQGGFTGVESYGVLISCSGGKISVLKTLRDPRLGQKEGHLRQAGTLDTNAYLRLWESLSRLSLFSTPDAPQPKMDILDEFTFMFEAQAGSQRHGFKVYGISRPEAARHFAIKNAIDMAAGMDSLWHTHQSLAKK